MAGVRVLGTSFRVFSSTFSSELLWKWGIGVSNQCSRMGCQHYSGGFTCYVTTLAPLGLLLIFLLLHNWMPFSVISDSPILRQLLQTGVYSTPRGYVPVSRDVLGSYSWTWSASGICYLWPGMLLIPSMHRTVLTPIIKDEMSPVLHLGNSALRKEVTGMDKRWHREIIVIEILICSSWWLCHHLQRVISLLWSHSLFTM